MVISRTRNTFYIPLLICLGLAGLLLLFTGWWLPETSAPLQITGLSWLLLAVATYFIRTQPYLQLAAAWLWFICSTWSLWKTTDERSTVWLLQNVLSILILVFCHLVVVNIVKNSRSRA